MWTELGEIVKEVKGDNYINCKLLKSKNEWTEGSLEIRGKSTELTDPS